MPLVTVPGVSGREAQNCACLESECQLVAPNVGQIANYVVFCITLRLVCGVYNSTNFIIRNISC